MSLNIQRMTENTHLLDIAIGINKAAKAGDHAEIDRLIETAEALKTNEGKVIQVFKDFRKGLEPNFYHDALQNIHDLSNSFIRSMVREPNPAKEALFAKTNGKILRQIREKLNYLSSQGKDISKLEQEFATLYDSYVQRFKALPDLDLEKRVRHQNTTVPSDETSAIEKVFEQIRSIFSKLGSWIQTPKEDHRSISHLVRQRNAFAIGPTSYNALSTLGDGTCALHALLGEPNNGRVAHPSNPGETPGQTARGHYLDALRHGLGNNQEISDEFVTNMTLWLNESIKVRGERERQTDTHWKKVFPEGNGISARWRDLQQGERNIQAKRNEFNELWESILKNPEQANAVYRVIGEHFRDVDFNIKLDQINNKYDLVFAYLSEQNQRLVSAAKIEIQQALINHDHRKRSFILTPANGVFDQYSVALIGREDYYLDTTELSLAAKLFNKKVKLVEYTTFNGVAWQQDQELNETSRGELVVIRRMGAHFERCIPADQDSLVRREEPSQQEGQPSPPKKIPTQ